MIPPQDESGERKAKKLKKQMMANAQAADGPSTKPAAENVGALFVIDTQPTKVDLSALKPAESEDGDEAMPTLEQRTAPSGLNRATRRRLMFIDRQRVVIRKKILKDEELKEGSDEFDQRIEAKLEAWIKDTDEKALLRDLKKKERKAKDAQRLRNKHGKILTGRRLKRKEKDIKVQERSKARKERKQDA